MDKKLQIVQYLYGEAENPVEVRNDLREESDLWEEYQAISVAKFKLDHRRRHRPDVQVLDNIFEIAAGKGEIRSLERRRDRRAIPHRARIRKARTWGIVGMALTVVVFFTVGIRYFSTTSESTPRDSNGYRAQSNEAVTSPNAEIPPSLVDRIAPDMISAQKGNTSILYERSDEDLDWNESEGMLDLYRRIEILRSGVASGWDEPALPIESFPVDTQAASPGAELQLAGQRKY